MHFGTEAAHINLVDASNWLCLIVSGVVLLDPFNDYL